jgi:hypothetical protein
MNVKWTSKDRRRAWIAIVAILAAGMAIAGWRHLAPPAAGHPEATALAGKVPAAIELSRRKALSPSFHKHPFIVAHENRRFGWTAEDGKRPDTIKQLAHNELEFERMAEESTRILRCQLVYHYETVDAQLERARLTGESLQQLALPGLDGQEIQVEITQADLNPSGHQGTLAGHVAGRLDSMVTFAFKGGREAFTILSPSDKLYLQGDPHEPGELIVKSIDPATYVVGVCGNP